MGLLKGGGEREGGDSEPGGAHGDEGEGVGGEGGDGGGGREGVGEAGGVVPPGGDWGSRDSEPEGNRGGSEGVYVRGKGGSRYGCQSDGQAGVGRETECIIPGRAGMESVGWPELRIGCRLPVGVKLHEGGVGAVVGADDFVDQEREREGAVVDADASVWPCVRVEGHGQGKAYGVAVDPCAINANVSAGCFGAE